MTLKVKEGGTDLHYCDDNRDKMMTYSFYMTIVIVIYHLVPHLFDFIEFKGDRYCRNFFELFGTVALNYFFAVSAYKFYVSRKTVKEKLCNRLYTLILPYIAWNTLYISLYVLQNGMPSIKTLVLGYTFIPFDGPLWYIFVLYIFLIVFKSGVNYKNDSLFISMIILISIFFAIFHLCVIREMQNFPFIWLERTCRMLPPFFVGMYLAKKHTYSCCVSRSVRTQSIIGAVICILIASYIGDGAITIILMNICTFLLWVACPNFELKSNSLMRQDTFSIYAVHEGLIVLLLALQHKLKIMVNSVIELSLFIIVELIFILLIGLVINLLLKKLPAFFDVILTGGRNKKLNHVK